MVLVHIIHHCLSMTLTRSPRHPFATHFKLSTCLTEVDLQAGPCSLAYTACGFSTYSQLVI